MLPGAYRYRIKYLNLVNVCLKMFSLCLVVEQKEYVLTPKALPAGHQLGLATSIMRIALKLIWKIFHLQPNFSKLGLLYVAVLKIELYTVKGVCAVPLSHDPQTQGIAQHYLLDLQSQYSLRSTIYVPHNLCSNNCLRGYSLEIEKFTLILLTSIWKDLCIRNNVQGG